MSLAATLLAPPPEPVIVTREQWGAKAHLPGAIPHTIHKLTIHHTGVLSNKNRSLEDKLRGLQTYSQSEAKLDNGKTKPAWVDIPYHYYISIDGRIGEGRDWYFAGDTNTEYDPTGHLLIVVEGEFGQEQPTAEELKSLWDLTTYCVWRWRLSSEAIESHRDYSKQTDCPGDALYKLLPELRSHVKKVLGK